MQDAESNRKVHHTEPFRSVTDHFFLKENLKRYGLTTSCVPTARTTENLAANITNVLTKWKLSGKITAIVTDNATNMIKICDLLGIWHMPCLVHTLNLTGKVCLEFLEVMELINKCKVIVKLFKKSSVGWRASKAEQKERNSYITTLKLIQEVSTI